MSIASEINRLQAAKADLKTAIEGKGVTVPSSTKLDGYSALVDSIQAGGGGENMIKFIEIDLTGKSTSRSDPYVIDITDDEFIYSLTEFLEESQYFRFNLRGRLSKVSYVKASTVLCLKKNGDKNITKYVGSELLY